jgi:hypothetical protein
MVASGESSSRKTRIVAGITLAAGLLALVMVPARAHAGAGTPTAVAPNSLSGANAVPNPADDSASFDTGESDPGSGPESLPPVSYHDTSPVIINGSPIGGTNAYLAASFNDYSPLGLVLRPDKRRLSSGEMLSGLTIIAITKGSAAARAQLQAFHNGFKQVMEVASIAGSFFFAPAVALMPILEASQAGDHYDMIVGVDGYRVKDLLDFADCMRDVQPNEPVYLSLVRDGVRRQTEVKMPGLASTN